MPWSAVATVRWPTQATRAERAPHGIGTRERIALRRCEKLTLPLRCFLFPTAMNGVVTPSVWPSENGYADVANPRIGQLNLTVAFARVHRIEAPRVGRRSNGTTYENGAAPTSMVCGHACGGGGRFLRVPTNTSRLSGR